MGKKVENYVFKAFGFDVVLHNVEINEAHGEAYPNINMNDLKLKTAKEIIKSKSSITGKKLKFLRTFLGLSFNELSNEINVPASTLRSWESKKSLELKVSVERTMRMFFFRELKRKEDKEIEMMIVSTDKYEKDNEDELLDIAL